MTPRGFTLLEVVVAMAILAMCLMAIFQLNSGAVGMHSYTKRLTVATLLARSKMTDLEQELFDKGFNIDDQEESGDFAQEGFNSFKWRARIIAPKTQDLSPEQAMGAILGAPTDAKSLSSLFGSGGASGSTSYGPTSGVLTPGATMATTGLAALGPLGGMLQAPLTQMVDQLTKDVREIRLTVTWKDGKTTDNLDLVTHVVSTGPGSDRNGRPSSGTNAAPGATSANPAQPGIQTSGNPLPGATPLNTNIPVRGP
jgi:general secretion pathway protein I